MFRIKVDITKTEVTEFFFCIFLSQIYKFLSQYYFYHKIVIKYGTLKLRPFQRYVYCKD